MSKTIEQIQKVIRMNNAVYNKVGMGEMSLKKAGSIFERQLSSEVHKALKMALEEIQKGDN
jgi:hypothetical protein